MPQGFNVYSYSLNNPLAFKDPSGKWFFLIPFVVGFVAGLVYGLADGQGWDAFGTALETGLTTGFGALLGGAVLGGFGAVMGGINGLFTGLRKTYDWDHIEAWASFVADSSWGIIGTSIEGRISVSSFFRGLRGQHELTPTPFATSPRQKRNDKPCAGWWRGAVRTARTVGCKRWCSVGACNRRAGHGVGQGSNQPTRGTASDN